MSRRKPLPADPVEAVVDALSHDGRGVAHLDGKATFIDGALPGERVRFRYTRITRRFDEGRVVEVLEASPDRVEPRCPHALVCGGCSLQHMDPDAQILAKQQTLLANLQRIGGVRPGKLLEPLRGPYWGYRHKARLGVKRVRAKGRVLVGFREKRKPWIAELSRCEVLHPSVGQRLEELAALVDSLSIPDRIPQIEVAVSDDATALVFRHLDPLGAEDLDRLRAFARESGIHVYLQPKGPDSVELLWPERSVLSYRLPEQGLELWFRPTDFTQVNPAVNRAMVGQALALLDPRPGERVLDLFCGLGNFTLPLAQRAGEVVGVEGDAALVERARDNAGRNGIGNAAFHMANLAEDITDRTWFREGFDKLLLDPPRSGAAELVPRIATLGVGRILYVSCHPGSLARDTGMLVNDHGYRLVAAGVMDMFPHTAHVESMALLEK